MEGGGSVPTIARTLQTCCNVLGTLDPETLTSCCLIILLNTTAHSPQVTNQVKSNGSKDQRTAMTAHQGWPHPPPRLGPDLLLELTTILRRSFTITEKGLLLVENN